MVYKDSVALTFHTKAMSAESITSKIGVEPDNYVNAGECILTMRGKVIKTGLQSWSMWSRLFEIGRVDDNYDIEAKIIEILNLCESHKDCVEDVLRDGGVGGIQIRLSGTHNIGDTFSAVTLKRISELGMSLSIEVFP